MRPLLSALALCLALGPVTAQAARPPDAREYFLKRQTDLVQLAGKLGELHRLHQLCGRSNSDRFRNHVREIIPLEAPLEGTRLDMIAAFNAGYREMSALHLTCGSEAESDYRRAAREAGQAANRLSGPFR